MKTITELLKDLAAKKAALKTAPPMARGAIKGAIQRIQRQLDELHVEC